MYVTFWDRANKWGSRFCHSTAANANATVPDTLEWNLTIGSDRLPSFNCGSNQGSMRRLRLSTAAHAGSDLSTITPFQHRNASLAKAPGQSSPAGSNARSGSQLTVSFKHLGTATMRHVLLHYDQIANLSAPGLEVLD